MFFFVVSGGNAFYVTFKMHSLPLLIVICFRFVYKIFTYVRERLDRSNSLTFSLLIISLTHLKLLLSKKIAPIQDSPRESFESLLVLEVGLCYLEKTYLFT